MNTIEKLASKLQKKIDSTVKELCEATDHYVALQKDIKRSSKQIQRLVVKLRPVESLIINQNPQLASLFESVNEL